MVLSDSVRNACASGLHSGTGGMGFTLLGAMLLVLDFSDTFYQSPFLPPKFDYNAYFNTPRTEGIQN